MSGRLEGKVAVVTGAGSVGDGWGNGRATAVLFAAEGAQVLAVDRDPEAMTQTLALAEEAAAAIATHVADVTDPDAVRAVMAAAVERFGSLDVLVNNVGATVPGGVLDLKPDVWDRQLELNLKSAYLACREAIPHMRRAGGGSIVNLSSTAGIRYTGTPHVAYASAKAAIRQLSRVVAVQHAPDGIRVNTIVPGQLHTPMVEATLAAQQTGGDAEALLAKRLKRIPLGFMGDGRDTAYAALYLASDESRFVTGAEIVLDGGMSVRCD